MTRTPHKHAEIIKAWADGAEIEWRLNSEHSWKSVVIPPSWHNTFEYRIKPSKKSPGQTLYEAHAAYWNIAPWKDLTENTQSYYIRAANLFLKTLKDGEIDGYD